LLWQAEYVNSKVKHSGKYPNDEDAYIIPAKGKEGNLKYLCREYLIGVSFLSSFPLFKG